MELGNSVEIPCLQVGEVAFSIPETSENFP